jgi:ABC-2 type transport system ATP-binding protein
MATEGEGGASPAVWVDQVTCRFGRTVALDRLSLRVEAHRVTGVVGPNGAGKTTLIDAVCGALSPTEGRVLLWGEEIRLRPRSARREVGVVPQQTALYEEVSARENLRFAAALYDVRDADRRIREVLEVVGLADRAGDPVRTLSGGMQRRLTIARALVHQPRLLVLDEPTLGVDIEARHQIWAHIRALRAEGRTVLLTTNYLDEAEALCDRIVVLRAGRQVADDTPAGLLAIAGRCLELECSRESSGAVETTLSRHPRVLRVEWNGAGLNVYVRGVEPLDDLIAAAMGVAKLEGFRVRSPDLVEVFKALKEPEARA